MLMDGKRLGNTEPRIFTPPLRPLEPRSPETERWTLGYDVCDFARDVLEMPLLPWQEWFFVHALELREDGSFRFKTILLLVARQNGKSTISLVLGLYALYILRWSTVLGVAQDLDTAEEILDLATELVTAVDEDDDDDGRPLRPWLAEQVSKVVAINGKRALQLRGRRRWKVKAATRGAGRGFSGDLILFDELREQKNWLAWGAVTKSTMARPHALIFALSNAGDILSAVLKHLRRIAHLALGDPDGIGELSALERSILADEGRASVESVDTLFLAEWSAAPTRAKTDRDGWCEADPSLGYIIEERTVAGACQTDPEWVFRTEVLCQWPDGAIEQPYPPGKWDECANGTDGDVLAEADTLTGPLAACIDVSDDNTRGHVVVAGYRADGMPQVEHRVSRVGTHWIEAFLSDPMVARRLIGVTAQERGAPVSAVLAELQASEDFNVPVVPWGGAELLNSYVDFHKLVVSGQVRHNAQPGLDAAAQMAATRRLGGVDVIDRRASPCDAAPLIGAVGAVWLLQHPPETKIHAPAPLPKVAVVKPSAKRSSTDLASVQF